MELLRGRLPEDDEKIGGLMKFKVGDKVRAYGTDAVGTVVGIHPDDCYSVNFDGEIYKLSGGMIMNS